MDTTTRATAARVEEVRIAAGLSRKGLSEGSGIPWTTLNRLLDGHTAWRIDQLEAVAPLLGVDPAGLVVFKAVA